MIFSNYFLNISSSSQTHESKRTKQMETTQIPTPLATYMVSEFFSSRYVKFLWFLALGSKVLVSLSAQPVTHQQALSWQRGGVFRCAEAVLGKSSPVLTCLVGKVRTVCRAVMAELICLSKWRSLKTWAFSRKACKCNEKMDLRTGQEQKLKQKQLIMCSFLANLGLRKPHEM